MKDLKYYFMSEALKQAKNAFQEDEVPVGAVIVDSDTNKIISQQYNKTIRLNDPTAHAEILAIREACEKIGNHRISKYDLYVTLEPCPMCTSAISWSRIRHLYYGAKDEKFGAIESVFSFFNMKANNHRPKIFSGLLNSESSKLLKDFFKEKRK